MKLYEYQGHTLFASYGIAVPKGIPVSSVEDAVRAAEEIGFPSVIKAQVHTGGRGKAGGIQVVRNVQEARVAAERILNMQIKGLLVHTVLVSQAVRAVREVYASVVLDRGRRTVSFIVCGEGGMDIETVAKEAPEKVHRWDTTVRELRDLPKNGAISLASRVFSEAEQAAQAANIFHAMGRLYSEKDCSLVEINPLIVDEHGKVMALDSKVILDDNALFRHEEFTSWRDPKVEDPDEIAAKEEGLSFVRLDGNIGCMVNGAGLAMATMDIIKHYGGSPANFLDVGGSSDPRKVIAAFELILKNPAVKVILVNIFGGITRCDDIARGIVESLRQFNLKVPLIVRLVGTNETEGRRLLRDANVISAETLDEAAARAAEIARAAA